LKNRIEVKKMKRFTLIYFLAQLGPGT